MCDNLIKLGIVFFVAGGMLLGQMTAFAEHDHDEETHGHHHEAKPSEFSSEVLVKSGIKLQEAATGKIKVGLQLSGRVLADEDRVVHVIPRFAGVIKEVKKKLGDRVEKGDVLAVIESNQSLQPYEVKSLISGIVLKRHASVGEFVAEDANIFILADLSRIVVDLFLFEPNFGQVKLGQTIEIKVPHLSETHFSKVTYVSSVVEESTQSKFVRAELDNKDEHFYPGQFIGGELVLEEVDVPLVVDSSAIQTIEGREVVYVQGKKHFEAREVGLGRRDNRWAEVLSGLRKGEVYASGNIFLIKAELGKSEAEHEH